MGKLLFIGHFNWDNEFRQGVRHKHNTSGGALFYSAMAASSVMDADRTKIVLLAKLARKDRPALGALLERRGVESHLLDTPETHAFNVDYPVKGDLRTRTLTQLANPGPYRFSDLPPGFSSAYADLIYLAGNTSEEFPFDFIQQLAAAGYASRIAIDMQCLIRQVGPGGRVEKKDVARKREIARLMGVMKLDDDEAEFLTGTGDMKAAVKIVTDDWGCPGIVITSTHDNGVYASGGGERRFARFTKFIQGNYTGRNGRGDTTFGTYLLRRLEGESVGAALRFATALVSVKMEQAPGAFQGTLAQVLARREVTEIESF